MARSSQDENGRKKRQKKEQQQHHHHQQANGMEDDDDGDDSSDEDYVPPDAGQYLLILFLCRTCFKSFLPDLWCLWQAGGESGMFFFPSPTPSHSLTEAHFHE